jgi:hypothetical protein
MAKKPSPKMLGTGAASKAAEKALKRYQTMDDRMRASGASGAMPSKQYKKKKGY